MLKLFIFLLWIFGEFNLIVLSIDNKAEKCRCETERFRAPVKKREKRAIGSHETDYHIPWQVSITWNENFIDSNDYESGFYKYTPSCSGVIVNENWILTTAKCLEMNLQNLDWWRTRNTKNISSFLIGFGDPDIRNHKEDQQVKARNIYRLKESRESIKIEYNYDKDDIGLIELDTPIDLTYSNRVQPACFLEEHANSKKINYGTISLTSWVNPESYHNENATNSFLRKAWFKDASDSSASKFKECAKNQNLICLRSEHLSGDQKESRVCFGDLGSPINKKFVKKNVVIGLTSKEEIYSNPVNQIGNFFCAHSDGGIATRISDYLSWIVTFVDDDLCLYGRRFDNSIFLIKDKINIVPY